jgi:hypothetical protein
MRPEFFHHRRQRQRLAAAADAMIVELTAEFM